jgi:hypothetical protein
MNNVDDRVKNKFHVKIEPFDVVSFSLTFTSPSLTPFNSFDFNGVVVATPSDEFVVLEFAFDIAMIEDVVVVDVCTSGSLLLSFLSALTDKTNKQIANIINLFIFLFNPFNYFFF